MGKKNWIYILRCKNNRYYVGTTSKLFTRIRSHANGTGSKITSRGIRSLVAIYDTGYYHDRELPERDFLQETCITKDMSYYRLKLYKTNEVYGGGYSHRSFDPIANKYTPTRPMCFCNIPASLIEEQQFMCGMRGMYDKLRKFLRECRVEIESDERCNFAMDVTEYTPPKPLTSADILKQPLTLKPLMVKPKISKTISSKTIGDDISGLADCDSGTEDITTSSCEISVKSDESVKDLLSSDSKDEEMSMYTSRNQMRLGNLTSDECTGDGKCLARSYCACEYSKRTDIQCKFDCQTVQCANYQICGNLRTQRELNMNGGVCYKCKK